MALSLILLAKAFKSHENYESEEKRRELWSLAKVCCLLFFGKSDDVLYIKLI